jgi:hypothetical protein
LCVCLPTAFCLHKNVLPAARKYNTRLSKVDPAPGCRFVSNHSVKALSTGLGSLQCFCQHVLRESPLRLVGLWLHINPLAQAHATAGRAVVVLQTGIERLSGEAVAASVDARLHGSATLLHLSLERYDKDLADTTSGMIGDSGVAWPTESRWQRLMFKGCISNGRVAVFELPPITYSLRLRIRLIRIRIHVIFSIDKTYVHCSDRFILFAALREACSAPYSTSSNSSA